MGTDQHISSSANPRSGWWLLHLEVGINRLAAQSELTGNAGYLDLFLREIVDGLVTFDPLLMEFQTLFFQSLRRSGMPGNRLGLRSGLGRFCLRLFGKGLEQSLLVEQEALHRVTEVGQKMPPVRYLLSFWRSQSRSFCKGTATIPTDDLHTRMG